MCRSMSDVYFPLWLCAARKFRQNRAVVKAGPRNARTRAESTRNDEQDHHEVRLVYGTTVLEPSNMSMANHFPRYMVAQFIPSVRPAGFFLLCFLTPATTIETGGKPEKLAPVNGDGARKKMDEVPLGCAPCSLV
jgi:hypothetical protein